MWIYFCSLKSNPNCTYCYLPSLQEDARHTGLDIITKYFEKKTKSEAKAGQKRALVAKSTILRNILFIVIIIFVANKRN